MTSNPYLLGHSEVEEARLQQQGEQLAEDSGWLLDQLGIQPGWRTIDVGCGPRGILDLLAERVGPRGSVVGVEQNLTSVVLAREFVTERGLSTVTVLQGDARATGLPRGSFDLVHLRLVLVNVPDPAEIIAELIALARPGGVVAVHDADGLTNVCEPPLPAWTRLREVFEGYAAAHGIDWFIGLKLPGLLRRAGLHEVRANPVLHIYPLGHPRRTNFPQFVENARERIVGAGLLGEQELNALLASVRAHLDDAETLVLSHLHIQAWGRKPPL